jgi:NADH:ubiquinone oxidoreductase subunit E
VFVNISSIFVWLNTNSLMKKLDAAAKVIFICDGKKCGKYSKEIRQACKEAIKECGLKHEVRVMRMGCSDNCKCAPVISIQPQNIWIGEVSENDVPVLFSKLF